MPTGEECHSPPCRGIVLPDAGDPNLGTCHECGLRYRTMLVGGWKVVGPVTVILWGRDPLRCAAFSFERAGLIRLTPGDGGADQFHLAKDLLHIAP
jgi:hypothetical protein